MNFIINILNSLSKLIFKVGIFDILHKAKLSKKDAQQVEALAKNKQLFEAVKLSQEILSRWPLPCSVFENKLRLRSMGNLLDTLSRKLTGWKNQIKQADELLKKAQQIEADHQNNPFAINELLQSLELYKHVKILVHHDHLLQLINGLERKIKGSSEFSMLS